MSTDAIIGLVVTVAALAANAALVAVSVIRIRHIARRRPGSLRQILREFQ